MSSVKNYHDKYIYYPLTPNYISSHHPYCSKIYTIFSTEGWDILRLGTFYSWDLLELGRFVARTFRALGRFVAWDVLGLGCYGVGMFWGLGRFVAGTFWGWDVL
jgi:hypothetical protein